MKKVKIGLMAIAFVVGIGGAFASKLDATAWFYLDASGNPTGNALMGGPSCDPGDQDCARLYNVNAQNQPISPAGQPVKGIHEE